MPKPAKPEEQKPVEVDAKEHEKKLKQQKQWIATHVKQLEKEAAALKAAVAKAISDTDAKEDQEE